MILLIIGFIVGIAVGHKLSKRWPWPPNFKEISQDLKIDSFFKVLFGKPSSDPGFFQKRREEQQRRREEPKKQLEEQYAQHRAQAFALWDKGNKEDAATELDAALKIKSDLVEDWCKLGEFYLSLTYDRAKDEKITDFMAFKEKAIVCLNKAIGMQPNLATAHYLMARALWYDDYRKALASYETALKLDPGNTTYQDAINHAKGMISVSTFKLQNLKTIHLSSLEERPFPTIFETEFYFDGGPIGSAVLFYCASGSQRQWMHAWLFESDHPNLFKEKPIGELTVSADGDAWVSDGPPGNYSEVIKQLNKRDLLDYEVQEPVTPEGILSQQAEPRIPREMDPEKPSEPAPQAPNAISPSVAGPEEPKESLDQAIKLAKAGRAHEAIKQLQEVVRRKPDHAEAYYKMGLIYSNALHNPAEAEKVFKKAISLNPDYTEAYHDLAADYFAAKRYQEAIDAELQAIRSNPRYPHAHYNLGIIYQIIGRHKEALESLRRAIEIKPDYLEAHTEIIDSYQVLGRGDDRMVLWHQLFIQGLKQSKAGNRGAALETFKKVTKTQPDQAEGFVQLAVMHVNLEQFQEAVEALRQAVKRKPDDECYFLLSTLLAIRLNRWQEGLEAANAAIRLNPNYSEAYTSLGYALMKLNRFEEAIKAHQQAIKLKPDAAIAHYRLGETYAFADRLQEAADAYQQALNLDPDDPQKIMTLGAAFTYLGRHQEAIELLQRAVKLQPDYVAAHYQLGVALARDNQFSESLDAFRETIALDPRHLDAHIWSAEMCCKVGAFDEALDAFRKALDIDPDDERISPHQLLLQMEPEMAKNMLMMMYQKQS